MATAGTADAVPALVASKGEELGLRTEIVPGLQTSLAFWRLDSDSELVYSADSGTTEPNGASKRHGIELNNHLVLNRWLLVDADMAWTHARYADANANGDTGNFIGNAVSRVGLLGLTVHQLGPWSAGLITRFIGAYPLSQDGTLTTPSAIVSNLQVKRTLTRQRDAAARRAQPVRPQVLRHRLRAGLPGGADRAAGAERRDGASGRAEGFARELERQALSIRPGRNESAGIRRRRTSPRWKVQGAGDPAPPGRSRGNQRQRAWGLT